MQNCMDAKQIRPLLIYNKCGVSFKDVVFETALSICPLHSMTSSLDWNMSFHQRKCEFVLVKVFFVGCIVHG